MDQSPPVQPEPDKDWADAVADAATHAQDRIVSAHQRSEARDLRLPVLLVGVAAFVAAASWSAYRLIGPGNPLPQAEQAADLRQEAAVLIQEIEAYREIHKRLPDPELYADWLDPGLVYEIVDPVAGLYRVTRSAGDVSVTYDGSLALGIWVLMGRASEAVP